jgi:hypothetical protein
MTLGHPTEKHRDELIDRVNAMLAEIGSFYRYQMGKGPSTKRDVVEITPSGKELEACEEKGWIQTDTFHRYEQLTDTAEMYHSISMVEDLIKRLQAEGILRKKVKVY